MEEEINKVALVNGKVIEHPLYEILLLKVGAKDVACELSWLLCDILLTKNLSPFLEVKIEELGDKDICGLYGKFYKVEVLKTKHKHLEKINLMEL